MMILLGRTFLLLAVLAGQGVSFAQERTPGEPTTDTTGVARRLELAAENRAQLELALEQIPASQRTGLEFLILHMPTGDLQTLSADFLVEQVRIAYEARQAAKWGAGLPEDIFLNEVLPYANVNESRDNVRQQLRAQFWPLVKDLDSISLAATRLNSAVFKQTGVKYSTKRRRADQGPSETMQSGLASCTGLSILLIDAYRACGIPARFVGTPLWSDGSGNHSWVEVWDGSWHFTGAAEPTGDELNQAWFTGRAAKGVAGGKHGIYAVSFRQTDTQFPLVWTRGANEVFAVDVTERYASPAAVAAPSNGTLEVHFRALRGVSSDRCQANLVIRDDSGREIFRGQTNDETADSNNHLIVKLKPGKYEVEFTTSLGRATETIEVVDDGQLVTLVSPD